jgi:hypothetical protein
MNGDELLHSAHDEEIFGYFKEMDDLELAKKLQNKIQIGVQEDEDKKL